MAGYKQAILNAGPMAFITFDGDAYDKANFNLLATPEIIIDESGNGNNALFHEDQPTYQGYMLGRTSLVSLEPANMYAISLGYNGLYPAYLGTFWPKTYMEIPNSSSFAFPNLGSFSVMLMYYKSGTEQKFRQDSQTYLGAYNYDNLTRTIISKGTFFNLYSETDWSTDINYFKVVGPDGVTLTTRFDSTGAMSGDYKHITYTWNVQPNLPTSKWISTSTLYVNGIQMAQHVQTYLDVYPNTNTADSFYIGGTPNAPTADYNDRCTEDTRFDQIAVFQTALSAYDVQFFFKKTVTYQNLLYARFPSMVIPFNDPEVPNTYAIQSLTGDSGVCQGVAGSMTAYIQRQQPGPSNIPGSSSTLFQDGGMAMFNPGAYQSDPFSPNGDFTVDFWFTCTSGSRGVLYAALDGNYNFFGISLQINWANNQNLPGALQFNVDGQHFVTSKVGNIYNDGFFHYVTMIRRGMTIELWVDGILQSSAGISSIQSNAYPNYMTFMSMAPGSLWAQGTLAWFSATTVAIQPPEIWARNNYAVIYKITGVITLEGLPTAATVRMYNHITGELVDQTTSSSVDGSYTLQPPVNMDYDIMILNINDATVRYRAYGPLIPSTYTDSPIPGG